MKDGAVIRLRRYGKPGATRIVLSHGNGLAINAYAPFWLPLAETTTSSCSTCAITARTRCMTQKAHSWENFFSDIEEVFQGIRAHFGAARTVAAVPFTVLDCDARACLCANGDRWDALCVFDPPMMPPAGHPLHDDRRMPIWKAFRAGAAPRQAIYDAPEQLAAQFRRPASLPAGCRKGADLLRAPHLRQLPDGRWTLCCPPAFEARVFREQQGPDSCFIGCREIGVPLKIIAGDPAFALCKPGGGDREIGARRIRHRLCDGAGHHAFPPDRGAASLPRPADRIS